ncbi:MarR family EPS-associated transcriptional regulator [Kineobactrum salinum]|uniref:MarR family EPS-associated transcriptional regulator n=1 Tax=Kineobactrum salinum TaxID=2708301 RepID=A0A6C0U4Q0_9GAMM|nr:MarR family EPS-associated transcriptional regulator [Kineobactrum salinum]QIB65967.1 MarR family EPS-associated transcriptional regulator [Kineobactrum salinum]
MKEASDSTPQDETHLRLMRLLEVHPDITQREMAERLGISLGGINYCLRALVKKGWVKMDNFGRAPNKLRYAYLLTPAGVAYKSRLTGRFLKRKLAEYEALKVDIEELRREMFECE